MFSFSISRSILFTFKLFSILIIFLSVLVSIYLVFMILYIPLILILFLTQYLVSVILQS